MAVRNRLYDIRHELRIDHQTQMADHLGLPREQYNRYENQRQQPTLEIALQIAQRLQMPIEDIFYIEEV